MAKMIVTLLIIFLFGCGKSNNDYYKISLELFNKEVRANKFDLFPVLMKSPVRAGIKYMIKAYQGPDSTKEVRLRVLYYFSKLNQTLVINRILHDVKMPDDYRLFAFNLLAELKDPRLQNKKIEKYVTDKIMGKERELYFLKIMWISMILFHIQMLL